MNARAPLRLPGRKWLIGAAVVVLIILAYLLAGFLLAPRLIRSEASQWASRHPGLSLEIGSIEVNPLRLSVSIHDLQLADRGAPLLGFGRLYVAVSPLSLFERGYEVTALYLDQPAFHVVIERNGAVNLAALRGPGTAPGASASPAPLVRIDDLRIDRGEVSFADLGRGPAARIDLTPITFRVHGLRTQGGSGGAFVLQASGAGASLAWQGTLTLSPLASQGTLSINGLKARSLASFLAPDLALRLLAGQMSLSLQYQTAYGNHGLDTHLSAVDFAATDLAVRERNLHGTLQVAGIEAHSGQLQMGGAAAAFASLPALTVRGVKLSGNGPAAGQVVRLAQLSLQGLQMEEGRRHVGASSLTLAGLRLPVQRSRSGQVTLLHFLATPASRTASTSPAARPSTPAKTSWTFGLDRLAVIDARAPIEDQNVSPTARFMVTVRSFTAGPLSDDLTQAIPITLHASIDRADLTAAGRVAPASRDASLSVSLARLPLKAFVPYLPLSTAAQVRSGDLGVRILAEVWAEKLTRLSGSLDVHDLRLYDQAAGTGLFGWSDFRLSGIQYRPMHLVIGRAKLVAPHGLVEILPNRTLNLAALAPGHATAVPAAPPTATHRPEPAAAAAKTPPFFVLLRRLDIEQGRIVFSDQSIEPHFRAPIDALQGKILNVSTSHDDIAHVTLAGQVINQFSPVTIEGSFNPYGLGKSTDVGIAFNNIQLPIFNPYTDFYAGYAIAQGTLSTKFHYRIVDRTLHADHKVVIDQLQWGPASNSKHRVGWPIRLATALLKDRDGVIRIDLPVTGSLDNPDFHIASIVWKMLGHLLEKIALAPFDLIGKLFAGAQQSQYIDFSPGSATLPADAAHDLAALAHALAQRPALRVAVPAGPAGTADRIALEDERLDALIAAQVGPTKAGASPTPARQLRALTAIYRARLGKRPVYPADLPAGNSATSTSTHGASSKPPTAAERKAALEQAQLRWLRAALRPTVQPSADALAALGRERATHVQAGLLAGGLLKPTRVLLNTARSGALLGQRIRLKLQLQ